MGYERLRSVSTKLLLVSRYIFKRPVSFSHPILLIYAGHLGSTHSSSATITVARGACSFSYSPRVRGILCQLKIVVWGN